jgi:hypothetical protein
MNSYTSVLLKSLSPDVFVKAIRTFDRVTLLIVSICWMTTFVVMTLALYTISLSVTARKAAEEALATEPTLPKIVRNGVEGKELQVMIDRLQHHYPEVSISFQDKTLSITATNGDRYHQWLSAIGQIDTVNPQFHWNIKSLCVGALCGGQNIMAIELAGEKVSLEMPQPDEKK